MVRDWRLRGWPAVVLAAAMAGGLAGCVERRYTIRTEPPGAIAVVNGKEIGVTPVSRSFTYYGDREIFLYRDGFQVQRVIQPIKPPWWDNLLTEFFTENLVPVTLRDEREFTYKMVPTTIPPTDQLLGRAEDLRGQAQAPPPPRRRGILGFFGF